MTPAETIAYMWSQYEAHSDDLSADQLDDHHATWLHGFLAALDAVESFMNQTSNEVCPGCVLETVRGAATRAFDAVVDDETERTQ